MSEIQSHKQDWSRQDGELRCMKGGASTGKVFATSWSDKSVKVFAFGVSDPVLDLPGLEAVGTGLSFNSSEEVLAGGDEKGGVTLWSLKNGKVARTLEGGSKPVTQIAFHPSGAFAVVAGHDLTTRVWDLREKKCVQTYSAHEKTTCVSFSPGQGSYIVSGGNSGLSKVWDVRAGKILTTLKKHAGAVTDIRFHPTDYVMATGGEDGVVNFWNAQDYSKITSSASFKEGVKSVSFAADGSAALAVSDSTLRVMSWDPYSLVDSVASMPFGPVRDAFVRKDKLYVSSVSKDLHSVSSTIISLTSGIKPFSSSSDENVNPIPVETVKKPAAENKPEEQAPAPAPKEEEVPVEKPVEAAPAPVEKKKEELKEIPVEPQVQQVEVVAPPAPVERKVEKKLEKKVVEKVERVERTTSKSSKSTKSKSDSEPKMKTKSGSRVQQSSGSRRRDNTRPSNQVVSSNNIGIVPSDRNTALGLKAEEFRSRSKAAKSDEEVLALCMDDHANMCAALNARKTHVAAIRAMWNKDQIWKAISQMREAKELSVVVDVFSNLSTQAITLIPMELLNVILVQIQCLLQSQYEDYCVLGCTTLRSVTKSFGSNLKAFSREKLMEARMDPVVAEKLEINSICRETLSKCQLQLKENIACGGRVGSSSREILALLRRIGIN